MRVHAQPRRLLIIACLLLLFGCSTPKLPPTPKPSAPLPAPPTTPAPTTPPTLVPQPFSAPQPIRNASTTISDGPWTECNPTEATIAITVTVRTNGLFRERIGVHFLRPALATVYRLVHLRPSEPLTIATKTVPEACSTSFHLKSESSASVNTPYSIHSSLKQIPVDASRAITLQLRVNTGTETLDEVFVLNGTDRIECARGPISAAIEITPPETAQEKLVQLNETQSTQITTSADDWDALHRKFQLTGEESRLPGWFRLVRSASLQFPDIRITSEQVEINDEHSMIRLRGPVQIEWDGRLYTAGDSVIRLFPGEVQLESSDITAR